MLINSPNISGSLTVTGNSVITGSLTVLGGINGAITGSATTASYVEYSNVANKPALVSGSGQISFNGITDKPTLISGSSQVSYPDLSNIPSGIVSGSSQISFNGITDKPTLVSGSSQITYSDLTGIPSGIVSGSAQVAAFGYATTGSNTFIGNQTITGSILGSGSLTIDGCITATGQIVAQTINVQQVTSSIVYSCGSNIFGTSLGNTQQFTGSMFITGSNLNANVGNACFQGSVCASSLVVNKSNPILYINAGNNEVSTIGFTQGAVTGYGGFIKVNTGLGDRAMTFGLSAAGTNNDATEVVRIDDSGVTCFNNAICAPRAELTSDASCVPLRLINGVITGGSATGVTALYFGDAGSGAGMIKREKYAVNQANLVLYSEYGYNIESINACLGYNGVAFYTAGVKRQNIDVDGITCFFGTVCAPSLIANTLTLSTATSNYAATITNVQDSSQGLLIRATDNDTSLYLLNLQSSPGSVCQSWVDRFVVTKGGNVGIGTCTPVGKLDVSLLNTRRFIVTYDDSIITIKGASDTGAGENLRIIGDNLIFNTNSVGSGTERLRISSTGIACFACQVCTPSVIFNTTGTSGLFNTNITSIADFNASSRSGFTGLTNNCNGVYFGMGAENSGISAGIGFFRESVGWNSALAFYTNCVTDSVTVPRIQEKMRITSGGNVGIGTTNPGNFNGLTFTSPILDVVGSLNIRGIAANSVSVINMGGETYRKAAIYTSIQDQGPYLGFAVGTSGTSSNTNDIMRLTSGGNVGIGTTDPNTKLEVNGTIRVSTNGTNGGDWGVDDSGIAISSRGSTPIAFWTNDFTNQRMRIFSTGITCFACQVCTPVLRASRVISNSIQLFDSDFSLNAGVTKSVVLCGGIYTMGDFHLMVYGNAGTGMSTIRLSTAGYFANSNLLQFCELQRYTFGSMTISCVSNNGTSISFNIGNCSGGSNGTGFWRMLSLNGDAENNCIRVFVI